VLGKRRQGAQVFYRIADDTAARVCRTVCTQVAIGADMNDQLNKEFV
jgi:ArsR family transcriptional regulator